MLVYKPDKPQNNNFAYCV